jgi:hypothetical protein
MADDNDERDRGVLTKSDREYLRGETNLSEGGEINKRSVIRQRIEDAVLDFSLLFDKLPDKDVRHLFNPDAENSDDLRDALRDINGFLHMATIQYDDDRRQFFPKFKNLVEVGIERSIRKTSGHEARATLDIEEIEPPPDPEYVYERLNEGEYGELTDKERQWLVLLLVKYAGLTGTDVKTAFQASNDWEMFQDYQEDAQAVEAGETTWEEINEEREGERGERAKERSKPPTGLAALPIRVLVRRYQSGEITGEELRRALDDRTEAGSTERH